MRVGIFHDGLEIPPRAGIPYRFYYLSKELEKQGVEIVLFLCDRFNIDQEKLKNEPFETHLFSPKTFYEDLDFVESKVKEAKVDVLQVDCSQTALLYGYRYSKNLKLPLVTEMHDVDSAKYITSGGNDKKIIDRLDYVQNKAGQYSDHIICMTQTDRDQLNDIGIKNEKITLVPNGVDPEFFYYSEPKTDSKKLIFLGNMFYPPNRKTAQLIIEKVMDKVDASLVCIGMVEDDFKNKYASEKVEFAGGVADIRPYLESGALAVAPIFEGSGMRVKFLNFASAGIPAISTSIGTSGYPKNIAFLEDDIEKYPAIINHLLKNPDKLIEKSREARKIVEDRFSWNRLAKDVISVYQKMIDQDYEDKGEFEFEGRVPLPVWLEEEDRTKVNEEREVNYKFIGRK